MGPRFRSRLRWIHRWAALTIGVVFVVVSLSGSVLLFQPQLFRLAHGELLPSGLDGEVGSLDRWVEKARLAAPGLAGPLVLWPPRSGHNPSEAGMVVFSGLQPGGFGKTGFLAVLVEPATGDVLATVNIDRSLAYAPLFLHEALWAGRTGLAVSAVMAACAVAMLGIGIYLWWPRRGQLLRKLSPRPWRVTLGTARPLHDWIGICTGSFLIVLAATGLYMLWPTWFGPMTGTLADSPGRHGDSKRAAASACASPIGFDAAMARARELAPQGAFSNFEVLDPSQPSTYVIVFQSPSQTPLQQTRIVADLDCGRVTLVDTPSTRSPGDSADIWLKGLHDGTVFGTTGQIVVTAAGMAPLVLLWSGVRLWFRRRGWLR